MGSAWKTGVLEIKDLDSRSGLIMDDFAGILGHEGRGIALSGAERGIPWVSRKGGAREKQGPWRVMI